MSVKMTGAQFKAFYASDWMPARPNVALDEWLYEIDGREIGSDTCGDFDESQIADTATVKIIDGAVYDQDDPGWSGIGLAALARRWLRAQTHIQIIIEVPVQEADECMATVKGLGWKVIA